MKSLLTALALLAATAAGAAEMPKEFRGDWCEKGATDELRYDRNPNPKAYCESSYDSSLTVTATGYSGSHGVECTVLKVTRRRAHYRLDVRCETDRPNDALVRLDRFQKWHRDGADLVIR